MSTVKRLGLDECHRLSIGEYAVTAPTFESSAMPAMGCPDVCKGGQLAATESVLHGGALYRGVHNEEHGEQQIATDVLAESHLRITPYGGPDYALRTAVASQSVNVSMVYADVVQVCASIHSRRRKVNFPASHTKAAMVG